MKETAFTDKKSILDFFSRMIESRDEHISKLQKQLEMNKIRQKDQNLKISTLEEKIGYASKNYESLKTKQQNLSKAIFQKI